VDYSSCPLPEDCDGCECGWGYHYSLEPNPYLLTGGLVGGPDENDDWEDDRVDYVRNEVGMYYNAAFQSVLAGLVARTI
jgi:endoglucanase